MDRQDFAKLIKFLAFSVPKYAPNFNDQEAMEVWYYAFKAADRSDLYRAITFFVDNATEFPAISQIKNKMLEFSSNVPKAPFEELVSLATNSRNIPENIHPGIRMLASKLGGWEAIAMWNVEDYHFKRKNVEQLWNEVLDSLKQPGATKQISDKDAKKALQNTGLI